MDRVVIRLLAAAVLLLLAFPPWTSALAYTGPALFTTGTCLSGGPVPPNPKNIIGSFPVNLQAGTSYTVTSSDACKLNKFTNAGAVAVSLPAAGPSFPSGWMGFFEARGAAGITITPASGTIEGAASYPLAKDNGAIVFSDGSNYHVFGFTPGSNVITINGVTCTLGSSCTIPVSPNTLTLGTTTLTLGGTTTTVNGLTLGTSTSGTWVNETSTSRTIAASDCGTTILFSNASASTATFPNSISRLCSVAIVQGHSAGLVTAVAGSGATMRNFNGFTKTAGIDAVIGVANAGTAATDWILTGNGQ